MNVIKLRHSLPIYREHHRGLGRLEIIYDLYGWTAVFIERTAKMPGFRKEI